MEFQGAINIRNNSASLAERQLLRKRSEVPRKMGFISLDRVLGDQGLVKIMTREMEKNSAGDTLVQKGTHRSGRELNRTRLS